MWRLFETGAFCELGDKQEEAPSEQQAAFAQSEFAKTDRNTQKCIGQKRLRPEECLARVPVQFKSLAGRRLLSLSLLVFSLFRLSSVVSCEPFLQESVADDSLPLVRRTARCLSSGLASTWPLHSGATSAALRCSSWTQSSSGKHKQLPPDSLKRQGLAKSGLRRQV